jgi:protein-glutamine gamma-glutamyltransferase
MHNPLHRASAPYGFAQGIAFSAVSYALLGGVAALVVFVLMYVQSVTVMKRLRDQAEDNNPYAASAEQVGMLGIIVFLPMIFYAGLLPALLLFIGIAMLALNLQTFHLRQVLLGLLICFVVICTAAAETREGSYLLFFFPFVFACVMVLMRLQVPGELSVALQVKNALLVCVGALLLYLFIPHLPAAMWGSKNASKHFYHDPAWVKMSEPDKQATGMQDDPQLGARVAELQQKMQEYRGQEHAGDEQQEGFSGQSISGDGAGKPNLNELILRIKTPSPLYLTSRIFDYFDGQQWQTRELATEFVLASANGFIESPDVISKTTYEVYVEADLQNRIPLATPVRQLDFPASALKRDTYGQWLPPEKLQAGTQYVAATDLQRIDEHLLAEPGDQLRADEQRRYTQLPVQFNAKIKGMAADVTAESTSNMAKATALEEYLRSNYHYTLNTLFGEQSSTALDDFLFTTKEGHCELFASAMVLMARSQGIPARLTSGISVRNKNPLTGFYEAKRIDAHAWAQVFIENTGWVNFEPTAYYAMPPDDGVNLTYEEFNRYTENQLRESKLLHSAFTLKTALLYIWQSLRDVSQWLVHEVRQQLPWLLSILLVCIVSVWLWRQYAVQIRIWWLNRQVVAYKPRQQLDDYFFYFTAIRRLQQLRRQWPEGVETVQGFLDKLPARAKDDYLLSWIADFNRQFYAWPSHACSAEDVAVLKNLFLRLYAQPQ